MRCVNLNENSIYWTLSNEILNAFQVFNRIKLLFKHQQSENVLRYLSNCSSFAVFPLKWNGLCLIDWYLCIMQCTRNECICSWKWALAFHRCTRYRYCAFYCIKSFKCDWQRQIRENSVIFLSGTCCSAENSRADK